eukprot:TRINITY_DN2363_c9_g1_i1.p1 TRINITY_DN2363_c9_g1~~TRINITY_DN2363_c9_g1_i1.p1  ORF type:complete len:494 (+),score=111.10 TRINITY_DN2363_c9_g1_i1:59-1540(+)
MRFGNILETVGKTPVVRLSRLSPKGVNIFVKLESFNPMGSVKDRLALGVIEDAEKTGSLKPGQTVVEATSGNTGIGLAMVCAQKGYPLVVTMAENMSVERRRIMRFLGAKVVLTPAHLKALGMVQKAEELSEKHGWFYTRQFTNEANAAIHMKTTAQEILADFKDDKLDYWVTGYGTGGTLKGVSTILKSSEQTKNTKICLVEPDNSALVASKVEQKFKANGDPEEFHPSFRPHLMMGWVPDFIGKLTNDAQENVDDLYQVSGEQAMNTAKQLAQKEGIFVGVTAGATVAGGLQVAEKAPEGSNILCMVPDTGERYLTTPMFESIDTEMNDEEIEISKSTDSARFDTAAPPPKPGKPAAAVPATDESRAYYQKVITENKIVIFSLEWCEFCWSVKKFFAKIGVSYTPVNIDSAEMAKDDWGAKVRSAATEVTSCKTIPQIFIGGKFVGGATDVFNDFKSGDLQKNLKAADCKFDDTVSVDPYTFLPKWLHPRS